MGNKSGSWYIATKESRPAGPFAVDQILESWRAGRLDKRTLCWREGMAQWLPLNQVEPFASAMRSARNKAIRRIALRMAAGFLLVVFLAVAGYAGYVYWNESATIRKAKALLAEGDYQESAESLNSLAAKGHFHWREASYLSAIALVKAYAVEPAGVGSQGLEKPMGILEDLCKADAAWRDRARSDPADVIGDVAMKSPHDLARSAEIAQTLEELKLTDARQLSQRLLASLKAWLDKGGSPEDIGAPMVGQILRLDASLSAHIIAAVLPLSEDAPAVIRARLAPVERWAGEQPNLARPLADALMQRAADLTRAGKHRAAELVLDGAEDICPDLRDQCAQKRLGWCKSRLAEMDYAGVLRGLEGMHLNNYSAAVTAEVVALCLEVVQRAGDSDPVAAQRAMDLSFQLQPQLADSEANLLLFIHLHSEPSPEKLRWCRQFLTKFPKSEHYVEVQRTILTDAASLSQQRDPQQNEALTRYLDAAQTQAKILFRDHPAANGLDSLVWNLATCMAESGDCDPAIELANDILKACPKTPLKDEIDRKLAAWRTRPTVGPRALRPERRGGIARQGTLEEQLLRRKRTINTSTAVYDAVANKDIWIIEVADTCTADQFDAEQTKLLRDWVSEGGVLWVNSNVLSLLGVQHSPIRSLMWDNDIVCAPAAGTHPIVENLKRVRLKGCEDRAHTLRYKGVIPLLALYEKNPLGSLPVGTTVWSLVPYGKGWISDPKPVDLERDDGALFWAKFCQFCLHELPWPQPSAGGGAQPPPEVQGSEGATTQQEGPLSGIWRASDGARLRIADDGKTLTIELESGENVRTLFGKLTRRSSKADSKYLSGTLEMVFAAEGSKRHSIRTTMTVDDPNHLRVHFFDCPAWDNYRQYLGTRTQSDIWTRADGGNGADGLRDDEPFAARFPPGLDKPRRARPPTGPAARRPR